MIEKQLTDQVVAAVYQQDLRRRAMDALVAQGVPRVAAQALALLSDSLTLRLEQLVGRVVDRLVESPAFPRLWGTANRTAHIQWVCTLKGDPGALVITDGETVSLDLSPVVVGLEKRLTDAGVPLTRK